MAISYSYPMGTPKLTDVVLGVQYEEMKDPAVKNFSIGDIVNLALEEVVIPAPAYKVYTALLTQTGTNAPVATVLENTLGGTVTFSRNQAGQYNINSSALFGNTPPFIVLGSNREPANTGGTVSTLITRYDNSSSLALWSMNSALTSFIEGYGAINNLAIEIRVYN